MTANLFRSSVPIAGTSVAFRIGLAIRLLIIFVCTPLIQERWFVDFVLSALVHPSIDPWASYLTEGGDPKAFPYGYVMLLSHALPVAAGAAGDVLLGGSRSLATVGFGLSILMADVALYAILVAWLGHEKREAIDSFYWLSPLTIYINYLHGQTDIFPTALIFSCLLLLDRRAFLSSGIVLGLAVSAKLSMGLIAPFVLIHLIVKNRRLSSGRAIFVWGFAIGLLPTLLTFALPGARSMIFGSSELMNALKIGVRFGDNRTVLLFPLVYLMLLFTSWSLAPLDRRSLSGFIALVFAAILLTTQAPIGWFLWLIPALVPYAASASRAGKTIVKVLGIAAAAHSILADETFRFIGSETDVFRSTIDLVVHRTTSPVMALIGPMSGTLVSALLLLVSYRVYRSTISDNWLFEMTRRPFMIGIAGDSGAGKDSLAHALAGIFGHGRVSHLLGDDYHRYGRKGPMWSAVTHLDPRANDLAGMTADAERLSRNLTCFVAHYDHDTGLFTRRRTVSPNDIVVVNGLHALYPQTLTRLYGLRIYLDIDEDLRAQLKASRDSAKRGATLATVLESIARRAPDSAKFIRPQREKADIVFSLQPARDISTDTAQVPCSNLDLQLLIETRLDVDLERFARELSSVAQLPSTFSERFGSRKLLVHLGFSDADDTAVCFGRIAPDVTEFLALEPEWDVGLAGVMQLFVCYAIASRGGRYQDLHG